MEVEYSDRRVGTFAGAKYIFPPHQETIVGYDVAEGELFVDRTHSDESSFHQEFAGRRAGPLPVLDGRVRLHVIVDWSSVEVFGTDCRTTITNRIRPGPEREGVALFAEGGTARLVYLEAWSLDTIWDRVRSVGPPRETEARACHSTRPAPSRAVFVSCPMPANPLPDSVCWRLFCYAVRRTNKAI